jgi:hypothetical protein
MRRRKEKIDEVEEREVAPELSEKELKKLRQKENVEKRKNAKKKDKIARWGGVILLGLMMFAGFLLWVAGEMRSENQPHQYKSAPPSAAGIPMGVSTGSVIVK